MTSLDFNRFFFSSWRVKILNLLRNGQHMSPSHSLSDLIHTLLSTIMWHWNETAAALWRWNLLKPNKKESTRIILCVKLLSRKPSLETEFHNYMCLNKNIPKAFLLLVLLLFTCFCLLFYITFISKSHNTALISLLVLRIWYLFLALIAKNCVTWEGAITLSMSVIQPNGKRT